MSAALPERPRSKILIVDDDEGVTQTFARMLRLEGYQVCTAMSAEKGLVEAEEHHPDAIILDLRMPLIDGLGFLRRLRARGSAHHAGGDRHRRLLPRRRGLERIAGTGR